MMCACLASLEPKGFRLSSPKSVRAGATNSSASNCTHKRRAAAPCFCNATSSIARLRLRKHYCSCSASKLRRATGRHHPSPTEFWLVPELKHRPKGSAGRTSSSAPLPRAFAAGSPARMLLQRSATACAGPRGLAGAGPLSANVRPVLPQILAGARSRQSASYLHSQRVVRPGNLVILREVRSDSCIETA